MDKDLIIKQNKAWSLYIELNYLASKDKNRLNLYSGNQI